MKNTDIKDPVFLAAVEAIDSGNLPLLKELVELHPRLVTDRLDAPEPGYFQHPYLLWFVADNPIRIEATPANVTEVTAFLIEQVKKQAPDTCQFQLNYTLGLASTGRILKECGTQIAMIDILIDAGAVPGGGAGALAHGNPEAAAHLIRRGGELTLSTAVGLGWKDDVIRMTPLADKGEQAAALATAGFYSNTDMVSLLLSMGVDPNEYPSPQSGFHHHATPLHQAVFSGSIEAVRLLVEAGARLDLKDKIYHSTPPGWAGYMLTDENLDEITRNKFTLIAEYLRSRAEG
ncbi:hypothetical protein GVN16_24270 [Emticicia sp. CRIBPO]|uniref:ankyrin repeat domain-containing protein n=1 Tax=Emticicia sp. CRIBPO TaxID=2683258 RepID=UPI00141306F9|nr:ankyrin repeat domain-containing protein [Emticicia sp. CRIBPO]NBA88913.1 hypothetical protein [Emticicia sp. CRIBPO]